MPNPDIDFTGRLGVRFDDAYPAPLLEQLADALCAPAAQIREDRRAAISFELGRKLFHRGRDLPALRLALRRPDSGAHRTLARRAYHPAPDRAEAPLLPGAYGLTPTAVDAAFSRYADFIRENKVRMA